MFLGRSCFLTQTNCRFAKIPDEPVNRIPSVVSKSDSSSSGSSSESSSDTEDSEEERRNKQLKMLEKEVRTYSLYSLYLLCVVFGDETHCVVKEIVRRNTQNRAF